VIHVVAVGAGDAARPAPIVITRAQGAHELGHELRMARVVPADLPEWAREQIAKDAPLIDAAFGDKVWSKRQDDGLGRKVGATDLRPGLHVWAPTGLKGYGRRVEVDSVAPGSHGIVQRVSASYMATVLWTDADTGETKLADCDSSDVRHPIEEAPVD
jgi:hypothetical protein